MEKTITDFLSRNNIDLSNHKVMLAVSTGLDSMSLLTSLSKLIEPKNIIIAHVNHLKRAASTMEEAFIIEYAKKNNHPYYIYHLDLEEDANFQERARNKRLMFFKKIAEEENVKYLFLAHHLDDDLETFIMRFLRGSSLEGYTGIDEYYFEDGLYFLRPFMRVEKKQLEDYVKRNKIKYFEDETNSQDIYTRNRIRHNIVKALEEENSNIRTKFLEFKDTLQGANKLSKAQVELWCHQNLQIEDESFFFLKSEFLKLSVFLRREVLFTLLKKENLSKPNLDELLELIENDKPNIDIQLKSINFSKSYDSILFTKNKLDNSFEPMVLSGLGEYKINDDWIIIIKKKSFDSECNFHNLWYNSNMLPLIVRPRQEGDRIEFAYGTKKLKKILIDQKVSPSKRDSAIVLEKDGIILALLGYASSIHLPATEQCDIVIELKENKI